MKIGIDIDGFLTDLANFQIVKGQEYFKVVKNKEAFTVKDIFECNRLDELRFWTKNLNYYNIEPRENASQFTHYLHKQGIEIYILTNMI